MKRDTRVDPPLCACEFVMGVAHFRCPDHDELARTTAAVPTPMPPRKVVSSASAYTPNSGGRGGRRSKRPGHVQHERPV